MGEQMALTMALTERMPQRYFIQNNLEVRLWYWAPSKKEWTMPERGASKQALGVGESQQLRCNPASSTVVMEGADGRKVLLSLLSLLSLLFLSAHVRVVASH